jgi:hypothetical protein
VQLLYEASLAIAQSDAAIADFTEHRKTLASFRIRLNSSELIEAAQKAKALRQRRVS